MSISSKIANLFFFILIIFALPFSLWLSLLRSASSSFSLIFSSFFFFLHFWWRESSNLFNRDLGIFPCTGIGNFYPFLWAHFLLCFAFLDNINGVFVFKNCINLETLILSVCVFNEDLSILESGYFFILLH